MLGLKILKKFAVSANHPQPRLIYKHGGLPLALFNGLDATPGQNWLPLLFTDESEAGEVYLATLYQKILTNLIKVDQANESIPAFNKQMVDTITNQNNNDLKQKIVNEGSNIECKYLGSKFVIGIGTQREEWQSHMIKLGYFSNYRLGVYYGATKILSPSHIPCLLQTQIIYKSALKIIQNDPVSAQPSSSSSSNHNHNHNQDQQVHLIQFETAGRFDPQQVSLDQVLTKIKSSYSWFDSSANRQLFCGSMKQVMGFEGDNAKLKWWVSGIDIDIDNDGDHTKILSPSEDKLHLL